MQGLKGRGLGVEASQQGVGGLEPIDQGHPFVCQQWALDHQALHRQPRRMLDLIHLLGTHPQLAEAGVQIADVDPITGVVLGDQANSIGLNAQVGVLCDQDHRWLAAHHRLQTLLLKGHRQDVVIPVAPLELRRQLAEGFAAAENHLEGSPLIAVGHPIGQVALGAQPIKQAGNLTGVASLLGWIALEPVDLLDHLDRDQDVVVFKAGQGGGIVQQHVGVEHEGFAHAGQGDRYGAKLKPTAHLRSSGSCPVAIWLPRPWPFSR